MKIVADENIPYVRDFFSPFGEVMTAPGRHLTPEQVGDADILLVRSVTRVGEPLLAGSKVRFVGTCTIGIDHLDTEYLQRNHIAYASAPGCNAGGVVQYVLTALTELASNWRQKRIGVIGCGNVGGRLCRTLAGLQVAYAAYDPFLPKADNPRLLAVEQALDCDIICVHTPYTTAEPFPTHHMIGFEQLRRLRPGSILLNAGRGGAIDNRALLAHLQADADLRVVLDVWEHEPAVNLALLDMVAIGTPHIAGYSYEGKLNGSAMIHAALTTFLGMDEAELGRHRQELMARLLGPTEVLPGAELNQSIRATYDIAADDRRMRDALLSSPADEVGAAFDRLRKTYPERREFSHFKVAADGPELQVDLRAAGFSAYD
jgi:erythronate-4-phosphate dehydrogenase